MKNRCVDIRGGYFPSFHFIFLCSLIFAGGLFLRIWGTWNYLPGMDEMQFMIIAAGDNWTEIWRRAQAEIHPPLASFIRHGVMVFTSTILPQRLLSVLAGMLTVFGMYRLGVLLGGCGLGLLCAAMMAFSPSAVMASVTVRNYAFLLLFIVWALVFFFRWQQSEKTRDMVVYCGFIFLACATHFSAFLVAIACGFAQGFPQLLMKRWKTLAIMAALHIPLLLLSVVLYHYYFTPGATLSQWVTFMDTAGHPHPGRQDISTALFYVLAYFFPFVPMASNQDVASSQWGPIIQLLSFISGLIIALFYCTGLLQIRAQAPRVFTFIAIMWIVAIGASMAGLYPFSATRHNYYFLPFFILPFAYLGAPVARKIMQLHAGLVIAVVSAALIICAEEITLWYDQDFSITWSEFNAGQSYLESHLAPGDVIVTEWLGAYYYLLYANDSGKTPYDRYTDVPYINHTTILAPFGPPIRPYSNWRPFRDTLMKRLQQGITSPGNHVWFVDYGWKNLEIWTLMECKAAVPLIDNFLSRENVLIFSINAKALSSFLENKAAWEHCYKDYKPLLVGYPFHAVHQPR